MLRYDSTFASAARAGAAPDADNTNHDPAETETADPVNLEMNAPPACAHLTLAKKFCAVDFVSRVAAIAVYVSPVEIDVATA